MKSIAALEAILCAWHGTLIAAFHDRRFLANIAIGKQFSLESNAIVSGNIWD